MSEPVAATPGILPRISRFLGRERRMIEAMRSDFDLGSDRMYVGKRHHRSWPEFVEPCQIIGDCCGDLPLLGRFYGKVEDERLQESRYYRNVDAIEAAESIRKRADNAKDEEKLKRIKEDRPEVSLHEKTLDAKRYLKNIDESLFSQKEKDAQRLQVMKDLNNMAKERESAKGR